MANTRISWATKVWNPVVGCSKVSPGCAYCYAERLARRLAGRAGYAAPWMPWTAPNAVDNVWLRPDVLKVPLHWRKPQRIFVNSMSDLFHEQVPFEFIGRCYLIMALAPQHIFLILTKRPERALQFHAWAAMHRDDGLVAHSPPLPRWDMSHGRWPLPNVWLGVSVEDQRRADERLAILEQIPVGVRFVSAEPLLGPLALRLGALASPNWVIVGGESGPQRREMNMAWARELIAQCQKAGVPVFVKQDSGPRPGMQGRFTDKEWALKEWPRSTNMEGECD